jgi:hypothetical protein
LGSRRGSADQLSLPLMIAAFVLVGGFLFWLNRTAEPTELAIEEAAPEAVHGASAILTIEDFLANPQGQVDAVVEVNGARIASRLGTQAFWIGPNEAPYLVKMGPELVEAGQEVMVESMVTVVGTVFMMSDSILSSWDEQGVFGSAGDRFVAEFAISFLEARVVEAEGSTPDPGAGN